MKFRNATFGIALLTCFSSCEALEERFDFAAIAAESGIGDSQFEFDYVRDGKNGRFDPDFAFIAFNPLLKLFNIQANTLSFPPEVSLVMSPFTQVGTYTDRDFNDFTSFTVVFKDQTSNEESGYFIASDSTIQGDEFTIIVDSVSDDYLKMRFSGKLFNEDKTKSITVTNGIISGETIF